MDKLHPNKPLSLLQVRLDDRLRYLVTLACAATDQKLRGLTSAALEEYFHTVSLYKRAPITRVYGETLPDWNEIYKDEEEKLSRETLTLGKQADMLWSESNITRMQMLDLIAPHLQSAEDRAILAFVESIPKYKVSQGMSYILDREAIDREWKDIQQQFEAHKKSTYKE